jgi:hypothetical protein
VSPALSPALYYAANAIGFGLQGLAVYLVIIWSRRHNKQFDQPTTLKEQ